MSLDNPNISETSVNEKDMRCAPTKKFENGSCIPLNVLVKMAEAYNKDNPSDTIPLSTKYETLNPKYKLYLVKQFKKKLKGKCDNNQQCWTKQGFMKNLDKEVQEELKKKTFRPKGPNGRFTWLNTVNIDEVMGQNEDKYPDFKFLGAVPIDFDDLPYYGIKNLKFGEMVKKGKSKLGIIFNTDRHDQPGQHWIAMYTDLIKGQCYYFDSYGIAPEKEVRALMNRISKYIKSTGKEANVNYNKMQHQKKGSECGVYSIAFILRLLRGDDFKVFQEKRISDEEINECRKVYFT
jgi:hypothetical protein